MGIVSTLLGHVRTRRDGSHNTEADTQEGDNWRMNANWIRHMWRLPEGWEVRMIDDTGRLYFVDHNTRSKTWHKPPLARPGSALEQTQRGTNNGLSESEPSTLKRLG